MDFNRLIFIIILLVYKLSIVCSQSFYELNEKLGEYYNNGDYYTAIEYAKKAKLKAEEEFGKEHEFYSASLINLAWLYQSTGNYSKAEPLFIEDLNINKKVGGQEHPDYTQSLNNLARLYLYMGYYSKAEPLFAEALNINKKNLGQDHPTYAASLNNIALLYQNIGNYSKAETLFKEALNIYKKVLGQNHPDYATSLDNLAVLYRQYGKHLEAEPLYVEALSIREKILGKAHPDYALSLNNLAVLYWYLGNYEKAEPLYVEALKIREKILGKEHPDYAQSLSNLAVLHRDKGNYSEAEPLLIEALDIRAKVLGQNHPDYATTLDNLAVLYRETGNYSNAEPLFTQAINIRSEVLGHDHPFYATSLDNLAGLYWEIGNYSKAEPLYTEALNIRAQVVGKEHPSYAQSLNNLASLCKDMGDYTHAEILYIEALNVNKNVFGQDHPVYATSLDNLAGLYLIMGSFSKAEQLFTEALNINKKVLGQNHPYYARSLNNIALLYENMGDYEKAELLYIEASDVNRQVFGKDHPDYATSLDNLALLYWTMGNYNKAEPLFMQANDNLNNQIEKTFGFLSEKEKEQFLSHNINYYFEIFNSFFLNMQDKDRSVNTVSYDNELIHKGMLLQSNTALRKAVYDSRDNDLIETYNLFIDTHKELAVLYSKPLAEREVSIDSLENIAEGFEKDLVQKAKNLPGIENLTGLTKTRWQNVQQSLKPNEAAIEFIDFHYYNNGWTDSILYCALVLRKDYAHPGMIFLFEERQLKKYLSTQKATNSSSYISKLYSYSSNLPPADTNKLSGNPLYRLVWEPVNSSLRGVNTVYLSLSGLLHKVAFDAIPVTDSTFLSDIYDINIVSSTRILTRTKKAEPDISADLRASLYGGITYSMDSTDLIAMAQLYQEPDYDLLALRSVDIPDDGRGLMWIDLPGTLTEVSDINKIFEAKQVPASLYTGKYATEESFKYMARQRKSPEVLHMATHGFFFPETESGKQEREKVDFQRGLFEEPAFTYAENPLLRSGILLAGASRIWDNMPAIENVEDGTLTAYEVSNMNLSNTRLVVLSACETGLGDVKGSEGVFGLQRAFKMAGVKYIIMSLWQVPDYQTSELMKLFYTNWLTGLSIKEAFTGAQQTMRKKYDPFYWAAFILVE